MSSFARLAEGLDLLDELLAEDLLEPALERTDWEGVEGRLHLIRSTVRRSILEEMSAALEEAGQDRAGLAARLAAGLTRTAALSFAAGDALDADRLLARAAELAPPEDRGEIEAARRDPRSFCRLQHARWLHARARHAEADRILRSIETTTSEDELKRAARQAKKAPRFLKSAPPLFRLNGCGVGLYGSRDVQADGSYVATYCVSLVFLPMFPLTAYRVRKVDGNSYQFFTREPLGKAARTWQAAIGLAALIAIGYQGAQSYLTSPGRLARVGIEEARRLEAAGNPSGAMAAYQRTATQFAEQADVRPAAHAVLRLAAASVQEPCGPGVVPVVGRVVAAFDRLPRSARSGAPAAYLTRKLLDWTDQIGAGDLRQTRAALAVLDLASRVAEGSDAVSVGARGTKLRCTLADLLAARGRPLDALAHFLLVPGDAEAMGKAQAIIEGLGDRPSLWIEAAPLVRNFAERAAKDPGQQAAAAVFRTRLERAQAAAAASAALVESGDEARITAAFARMPHDQELAVALAAKKRARGDAAGCIAQLRALGEPGRLTGDAQQMLGACEADQGHLAQADEVLSALLDERLAPFQRARRDYASASDQLEKRLIAEADRGALPADLDRALTAAPKEQQAELFQKWLSETMAKDARLGQLRAEYLRHRAVVPASLTLGTVKLLRAGATQGEERRQHLEGAEQAFLSIREEAEGAPEFHLGLGQVFFRLGRASEGEQELKGVLDRQQPELTLQAVNAYRELGLESRAREVAEGLYRSAPDQEWKQRAARARALCPLDFADEELWLGRSDQSSDEVKTRLLETRAYRSLQEGKRQQAEGWFAQAAAHYDRSATHNSSSANNAAIAYLGRYSATGDPAHLKAAVARLEAASRLEPDSSIVLGNLADALESSSLLAVLGRWIRTRDLLLSGSEAKTLVRSLRDGPLRQPLMAGLEREPSFLRHLEVTRQEQVLAPQKPAPHWRMLQWFRWRRDTKALQDLAKRIESVAALEREAPEERAKRLAGTNDARDAADAKKAVRQSAERLARLQKGAPGATLAAAYLLYAEDLETATFYEPTAEAYLLVADAYRKASDAWPEAGIEGGLSQALLWVAAWRAAGSSPALKAALDKERRLYHLPMLLHRVASGPASAEVLSALRRQPELAEAARLRRAGASRQPGLVGWIVGRLAGDADLERVSAAAFARTDLGVALALDVKLYPYSDNDQADLALFKAGPRGAAGPP